MKCDNGQSKELGKSMNVSLCKLPGILNKVRAGLNPFSLSQLKSVRYAQ